MGFGPLPWVEGIIVGVDYDATKTQPAMTFTVAPLAAGRGTGGPGRRLEKVICLAPMFGSITDVSQAPTGLYGLPLMGASVMVVWTGSRWAIIGFFTGPCVTALETGDDPDGRLTSHNSGHETALNRLVAPAGNDVPLMFGLDPGDVIMGSGQSRCKVGTRGVLIGFGVNCLTFYSKDQQRLDRFANYEGRGIGWWLRRDFRLGNNTSVQAFSQNPTIVQPPQDSATGSFEVIETSPYPQNLRPYILRQAGHLSRSIVDLGRSSVQFQFSGSAVQSENVSGDYAVLHEAVVVPTAPDPPLGVAELDANAYAVFDKQVDADGSFRLRSGNSTKLPGGQKTSPTTQLDFSLEYNAQTKSFVLRVGPAGSETSIVEVDGSTPANAAVSVTSGKVTVKAAQTVDIRAVQTISLTGSKLSIDAAVEITGAVKITGDVVVTGDVVANGVSLATHQHPYVNVSSPATTGIPLPEKPA